jgi:hypothetical protein
MQCYTRYWVKYRNRWNGKPVTKKEMSASEIDGLWGRRNGGGVIINTIVIYMRRMFDDNDVVHVVATTWMAAFNVLVETLYRFEGLDWRNIKKGMKNSTMEKLQKKLQNTVAIFMDERSMLSQIILGLVEHAVARSAHECGDSGEDWGGIPVIVLFRDDYQLP